jgi:hypothetical protein
MNKPTFLNHRLGLVVALAGLILASWHSPLLAEEAVVLAATAQAKIYHSSAPWDGAAYAIEIPLEAGKDSPQGYLHINLWGNPEFSEITAYSFSGSEDLGGGPGKGVGRASYQVVLNKSQPIALKGFIEFGSLQKGKPVIGIFVLTSLDDKRQFSGKFEAAWGNKPVAMNR